MHTVHIVEERAPYLLLAHGDRFAVVERRNGRLYNLHDSLHCGGRVPGLMTDAGAVAVVGDSWCDETRARRIFDEIVTRYADVAERLW